MKGNWWVRFTMLIVVLIVSIMMVLPTALDFNPKGNFPVKSKINLGLDLQGGLYMVLGIDFKRVFKDEIKSYMRRIEYSLKDIEINSSLGELDASDPRDPKHSLVIGSNDQEKIDEAKKKIKKFYGNSIRLTREDGPTLEYGLSPFTKTNIEEQSVEKSIEVVRNRIDEFGVMEPEIISQGSDSIIVQLPGVKDVQRAQELIGKTAKLEFKLVHKDSFAQQVKYQQLILKAEKAGIKFVKGEQRFSEYLARLNNFLKEDLPKGYQLAFGKREKRKRADSDDDEESESKSQRRMVYVVENDPQLTGDDLEDARVNVDQRENKPVVSLTFKTQAGKRFAKITEENVGRQLAVILDGNVYTAPNIRQAISGGRAQIEMGRGNMQDLFKQAKDIALILRAGALPVPLEFEEQRVVGPSLGKDSIEKAKVAALIGCAAVLLFVILYYKLSGLIACVTLSLNILFIMAALVALGATLTLPGIAGIALTVGMAVDATIIIYERIREELHRGMNNFKAMESGFKAAFWTIIDANITTALAGLCLLNFGTGPIRGFAVTLLIGIMATVYCSYFLGKLFFEFYLSRVGGKELSI